MADTGNLTVLMRAWQAGDGQARERLNAAVYQELRVMARRRLAGERGGHTLQPTALVHEAWLRMADGDADWRDRAHFFATAALHMRSVLVDHARARLADKRGGGALRVTLDDGLAASDADADFLALDQALAELESEDARTAKVIELTYFAGLKRDEIAHVLEVSVPTVDRALRFGRAWLRQALAA
ncbi:MAG: ECF-type sigma factor [Pseudoxanthomonas sp.]|nr:ECF-type sigma factor [Pseudoxanthomonas sp.]